MDELDEARDAFNREQLRRYHQEMKDRVEYMRPFLERMSAWIQPYWREVMKLDPAAPEFAGEGFGLYRVKTAGAAEVLSRAFFEAPDIYAADNAIGPVENRALRFTGKWIQQAFDRASAPKRLFGEHPGDPAEEYYDSAGHVMYHTKAEINLEWLIARAGEKSLGSRRRSLAPVVSRRLPRDQARIILHSILPDDVYGTTEEFQRIGLPEDIPVIESYRGLDPETDRKIARASTSILRRAEKKAR
jgi:hypothetical protein